MLVPRGSLVGGRSRVNDTRGCVYCTSRSLGQVDGEKTVDKSRVMRRSRGVQRSSRQMWRFVSYIPRSVEARQRPICDDARFCKSRYGHR